MLVRPEYYGQGKAKFDPPPLTPSTTLQEMIQNAEDAGATEVTFLYDKHTYGTDTLYQPELAKHQVRTCMIL